MKSFLLLVCFAGPVQAAPGMHGMGGGGMGAVSDPASWKTPSAWETDPAKLCLPLTARMRSGERIPQQALEECRAEADARHAERAAAAPTLQRRELDAIPEAYLIGEERQRLDVLIAEDPTHEAEQPPRTRAERQALHAERSAQSRDAHWLGPAWSAAYCAYATMTAGLKGKKDTQARIQNYARSMKTITMTLKSWGTVPLPCNAPLTVEIRRCMQPGVECSREIASYLALVPVVYP